MQNIILVFLGGGLGSVCRYLLSRWMNQQISPAFIPYGTFSANMLGCFLIGVILSVMQKYGHLDLRWSILLATGFCGGFTTFSSFAYENILLWEEGKLFAFVSYIFLSILLGLLATFLGIFVVKTLA